MFMFFQFIWGWTEGETVVDDGEDSDRGGEAKKEEETATSSVAGQETWKVQGTVVFTTSWSFLKN